MRALRPRSHRTTVVVTLSLGALALAASCASSGDDKRRGDVGMSCRATDDCLEPLPCIAYVCGGPTGTGGHTGSGATGGGGSGATGGGASGGGGSGSGATGGGGAGGGPACDGVGPGLTLDSCDACLETDCHAELCQCGDACVGIEACLETVCRALTDAAQEGQCQVYCQGQNPGGKDAHVAVVNCAYTGACIPPCQPYPAAWNDCRAALNAGDCADERAACQGSADCLVYQACTDSCATSVDCIACAATLSGATGRILLETYERCIARECVAQSWAY
ncbi:MAG: hypothetical protein IT373_01145 [Polyangiaceae bacterium]|nr:hypothetical protein [Polyangiaceae bacterium]